MQYRVVLSTGAGIGGLVHVEVRKVPFRFPLVCGGEEGNPSNGLAQKVKPFEVEERSPVSLRRFEKSFLSRQ